MSKEFLDLEGMNLDPIPAGFTADDGSGEDITGDDNVSLDNDDIEFNGIEPLPKTELPEDNSEDALEDEAEDINDDTSDNTQEEAELTVYGEFADEFVTKGLLPEGTDLSSFKDAESLVKAIQANYNDNLKAHENQIASNIATEYKNYLPKDEVENTSEFLKYTEADFEDNDELSKQIISHYYKEVKGLDDRVISTIIESEVDLESTGKEIFKSLNELEIAKQAKLEEGFKASKAKQVEDERLYTEQLANNTKSLNEFVPGYKVTEKKADKILNSIPDVLNTINADKAAYLPKLALMMELGFFDGKFDTLINTGATKNTTNLEKALKNKNRSSGFNNKSNDKPIVIETDYSWFKK